ncbi:MAG: serine protein kinase PrkA [Bacteroidetes bacterium]|nr:MAG: serine protein kinase PrkA [Bacteroidota bacterium]
MDKPSQTSAWRALQDLGEKLRSKELRPALPFRKFLEVMAANPELVLRDIFQLFHNMVYHYITKGEKVERTTLIASSVDSYNFNQLFEIGCDNPFFNDRLFARRFLKLTDGFKKGIQNNNIFLFEGPPGSGKSTFLNNLLQKFEDYTKLPEGTMYQTYWRLDIQKLGGFKHIEKQLHNIIEQTGNHSLDEQLQTLALEMPSHDFIQLPCPNHDHPVLHIPKNYRRKFLEELLPAEFREKLFNNKEYEWVFKETPCSVCSSLYGSLLDILGEPLEVLDMIYARPAIFSRQFGEGISVHNPGDPLYQHPIKNPTIQKKINELLENEEVSYLYSSLAKTNNGIFALMDIKEQNVKRLMDLHGIISDGIHRVELIEERVKSLFVGLVNPADKAHYEQMPSFRDRIITVNVPYVLDYNTETAIYKNKFGANIDVLFLPNVLENVAKIIVSSRMSKTSPAIQQWIKNPSKYTKYLDTNYLILKMEIYAGKVPAWLSEEDLKSLDKRTRKDILAEAETEGNTGYSGRQSLNVFNDFLSKYLKTEKLITMDMVNSYFNKKERLADGIPENFVTSLVDMYDFNVLQEVKDSIYSYNEEEIAREIQNYLYAINFEDGEQLVCPYTNDTITVSDDFFYDFEAVFLGNFAGWGGRMDFRENVRAEYISQTLSQEIHMEDKRITQTAQFKNLLEKYKNSLKENALAPRLGNENFRRAIQDYGTNSFNSYDTRLRQDVVLLLKNLQQKFKYTEEGAKQVSLYVLDKNLADKYNFSFST